MPSPLVSAVPAQLLRYADAAGDVTEALTRTAGDIDDALDHLRHAESDVPIVIEDLGGELQAAVGVVTALDRWVGRTGLAFLLAGQGQGFLQMVMATVFGRPDMLVGAQPYWTDEQVADALSALLGRPADAADGEIVQPLVSPDTVRAFMDSLTDDQRDALLADRPDLVGPVDGMPHELRYAANRVLIDRALDAARAEGDTDLVETLEALEGDDRQFLFFDPAGDGRVAEVFGDLAAADNVAVFVPGITNRLDNFGSTRANASNLYNEMRHIEPGHANATIAWLGYDTPELADAIFPGRAHESAPLLRQLWDGLGLPDDVNTTIVGHSYGSLVSGTAVRDGFDLVDRLVVVGSPGLQADHVDDLHLADGVDFYAARAPFDTLVGSTESYGRDPTDPRFGATRLETGRGPDGAVTGHSSYLSEHSDSARNLAFLATGYEDQAATIEPGLAERAVGVLDDAHELIVDSPLDFVQGLDEHVDGFVDGGIDAIQERVPLGPLQGVIDDVQGGFATVDHFADAAVDGIQRVASPDFVGDVVGDFIAVDGPRRTLDAVTGAVGEGAETVYDNTLGRLPGL